MAVLSEIGDRIAAFSSLEFGGSITDAGSHGMRMAVPQPGRFRMYEVLGTGADASSGDHESGSSGDNDAWSEAAVPDDFKQYREPVANHNWWWTYAKEVQYVQDAQAGWRVDEDSDEVDVIWGALSEEMPTAEVGAWVWCMLEAWSGRWVVVATAGSNPDNVPILNVTAAMQVWDEETEEYYTDAAGSIPAYGVVQLDALRTLAESAGDMSNTESSWHAPVQKPAIPFTTPMYINGASSVPVDEAGTAYDNCSGPVLFEYELDADENDPLPGCEMGPRHRNWYLHMSYPSCVTVLAVVDPVLPAGTSADPEGSGDGPSNRGKAYGQWHPLKGGPRLSGRATERVTVDTQWFYIDTVQVIDYGGVAYTNQDGTVSVYNPGRDENTFSGYCLEQGMTIEAVWDATLLDGLGAYKIGDSPCGACL
jgi:hypothetical protein